MSTTELLPARLVRSVLTFFFYFGAILIGMAIIGMLLVAVFAGDDFLGDVSVRVAVGDSTFVPIARFESDSPAALSSPALVGGTADLRFETNDRVLMAVTLGSIIAGAIVVLYVVWILRAVLGRVLAGRPFDVANVRALHVLAGLSVVSALLFQTLEYLAADLVLSAVEVQGISLSPPFDIGLEPFLVALLLEVLAAIFRHGAELEAERSLTI